MNGKEIKMKLIENLLFLVLGAQIVNILGLVIIHFLNYIFIYK